ncbi:MAG: response regulator [bacterium]|nr:response regulator [Candidatus Jorgensenbacteria bacterium]
MSDTKKILIVEDELLLGNLLKQRFEKEGIEVMLAHDGEEALNMLRSTRPDLILLDIILPKISGFELLETMAADPSIEKAPVVITSNLGQDSDVKRGQALGAVGYFVKAKISIDELVDNVKNMVETGVAN